MENNCDIWIRGVIDGRRVAMKSVLITWELGGGMGHIFPIYELASELIARGIVVNVAAKDLEVAGKVLRDLDVRLFQAPHRLEPIRATFPRPVSYYQLLHNIGFGEVDCLTALIKAWQAIFVAAGADAIVFEHSPIALFAAIALPVKKALMGTGFSIPPTPLPFIRAVDSGELQALEALKAETLASTNTAGARAGIKRIYSLDEIYECTGIHFLRTYPELDHFGVRPGASYFGVSQNALKGGPHWPDREVPRVFAYLKKFRRGRDLIQQLARLPLSVIAYCPFLSEREASALTGHMPNIQFCCEPLDISSIAHDCDAGICHGGHGTTAMLLLRGIPIVGIPLHQEQVLLCERVRSQNLGTIISPAEEMSIEDALNRVLRSTTCKANAMSFAQTYQKPMLKPVMNTIAEWVLAD